MSETPVRRCPACNSARIGHFRYDSDWGHGGDFAIVNRPHEYLPEQVVMSNRNERPDIECFVCLDCAECFNTPNPLLSGERLLRLSDAQVTHLTVALNMELRGVLADSDGARALNEIWKQLKGEDHHKHQPQEKTS